MRPSLPLRRTALALACCTAVAGAQAENWRITPSVGILETYTNNVNSAPSGQEVGDWITSLTAAVGMAGEGRRVKLNGSIAVTTDLYARENQNNTIYPTVNLFGSVEAIERFLFIDATANVSQTYQSAFGPQPGNNVNATANRYTDQTYSLSPYVKGVLGATDIVYEVRDDNYWTIASQYGDFANNLPNTYANNFLAYLASQKGRAGWRVEYNRYAYVPDIVSGERTDGNGKYTIQLARGILSYQYDPALQVSLRAGYEDDQFLLTSSSGAIYGAGFQWNPNERTQVGGFWEERFFGPSYQLIASHRRPNSAFNANASRGLTTTPVSFSIPAGANVTQFLDSAFTTRIPDPAQRAEAVEQFLSKTGLPPTLASPVSYYGASILLTDAANVSFALLGVRNALTFSLFYLKQRPISGTGDVLPPALQGGPNDNTQTGGGVGFSHQLTGLTSFVANASYNRTTSNVSEGALSDTASNNVNASVGLATRFGPKTTGTAGVSYYSYRPTDVLDGRGYDTFNVYAGVNHQF
ncbi:MAG: TIGR03016 family PEP-CTERM system-associated outer membrane protein [Betaproteobacteria bacterium]|nr:TIGR03016 family PEP-CTERM system-associated outer membrane protein [Betaproteobacteria bacterium]